MALLFMLVGGIENLPIGYLALLSVFLAAIPTFFTAIMLIIRRKSKSRFGLALVIGSLVFAFLAVGLKDGVESERDDRNFVHQPQGCEFGVTFPETPTVKRTGFPEVAGAVMHEASQAELNGNAVWTDCTQFDFSEFKRKLGNDEQVVRFLAKGLAEKSNWPSYRITMFKSGPAGAELEASKVINGQKNSYRIHFYLGETSLFAAYHGADVSTFPTRRGQNFLKSITYNGIPVSELQE